MKVFGCPVEESLELVFLLALRGVLLVVTGWGLVTMRRLFKRGEKLEFPIVPPKLVKLTAVFLASNFAATVWITVTLFAEDNRLCGTPTSGPIGPLSTLERFVYGWSLVFALACSLWIINIGLQSYRRGPKVDEKVLDAIVEGMAQNPGLAPHERVDE